MTPTQEHSRRKDLSAETDVFNQFEYRGFAVEVGLQRDDIGMPTVVATATKQDDPHADAAVQRQATPSFRSYFTFGLISPDFESMATRATEMVQTGIDSWHDEINRIDTAIERGIDTARRSSRERQQKIDD